MENEIDADKSLNDSDETKSIWSLASTSSNPLIFDDLEGYVATEPPSSPEPEPWDPLPNTLGTQFAGQCHQPEEKDQDHKQGTRRNAGDQIETNGTTWISERISAPNHHSSKWASSRLDWTDSFILTSFLLAKLFCK